MAHSVEVIKVTHDRVEGPCGTLASLKMHCAWERDIIGDWVRGDSLAALKDDLEEKEDELSEVSAELREIRRLMVRFAKKNPALEGQIMSILDGEE